MTTHHTPKHEKPGRPTNPNSMAGTARRLTKTLGFAVSAKAVREWRDKGYPLNDHDRLLDCLAGQKRVARKGESQSMAAARLEKIQVEIETAKLRLDVERGKYLHTDDIIDQCRRIGRATRSELMRFKSDVPTWEGLPAAEMDRRVTKLIESICATLHDSLGKVYHQ